MQTSHDGEVATPTGPPQLSLFPRPRVSVEYFAFDWVATRTESVVRGCFSASLHLSGGAEWRCVEGSPESATLELARELKRRWPDESLPTPTAADWAWVDHAVCRLDDVQLGALLLAWAEEPRAVLERQRPDSAIVND